MKNQILSVDTTQKGKKNNSNKIEINKVVITFVIILIIFGVGILGVGFYSFFNNNNIYLFNKPKVTINEQEGSLEINAYYKNGISKITYKLNSNEEKVIEGNGQTTVEDVIELPVGNSNLQLTLYDINGKTTKYESNYEVESKAPQLAVEASNGKIKIIAKDNTQMSYLTYRWDDEEETKVEAQEESIAQIEQEVEIPKGTHKLTVVAVNSSNLTSTKEQEVKGVTKPKINVVQDSDDNRYLIISVSDDEAVKLVEFELNGKKYEIDLSDYHEKSIEYKQEMTQGENNITVKATNFDGAEATFEGVCTL